MSHSSRLLSIRPRTLQIVFFLGTVLVAAVASGQPSVPAKRPLTHADSDGWKSVQQPALSRDGRYLAYNLMPSDADGEFVVRNLATGGEHRVARGKAGLGTPGSGEAKGAPPMGEYADEAEDADGDQQQPQPKGFGKGIGKGIGKGATPQSPALNSLAGAAHQFTPDSKAIVFALIPTKAEIDKARQEKKSPGASAGRAGGIGSGEAMSRPRFLADQDFNENILRGVLRLEPAVEFLRLRAVGLEQSSDVEVLAYAATENCLVVSHDVNTMSAAANARLAAGQPMNGLLLVHQLAPSANRECRFLHGSRACMRLG